MGLLIPETSAPVRPAPAAAGLEPTAEDVPNTWYAVAYVRSYLLMRAIVGLTGLALPLVLIFGNQWLEPGRPLLGSLSSYYYSGMRDAFVGALVASGVFLLTYKIFERSLNNLLSIVAGLAAFAVAFFPTGRLGGDDAVPLTPLQERLGEEFVGRVHYISAGVFILSLAIISFFFGIQEGRRTRDRIGRIAWLSPRFWRWFHWICAAIVLGAVTFMVVDFNDGFMMSHSLLVGETIAVVFFGLSWSAKGLEFDVLMGTTRRGR